MAGDARAALVAFVVTLVVYLASGWDMPDSHDTTPNAYLPVRVLAGGGLAFGPLEWPWMFHWSLQGEQGSVRVDVRSWDQAAAGSSQSFAQSYQQGRLEFAGPRYFVAATVRERAATGEPLFVSAFGPIAGLVGVPVAAAGHAVGADLGDPYDVYLLARITAALLTAGSVAIVFLTALGFTTRGRALLLAGAYGLGSCVWTLSSQALWQQTPALFFLSLGAWCLVRGGSPWSRGAAAGLAFAVAAACRPTAGIVALVAASALSLADRRSFAAFLVGALPVGVSMLGYNLYYFGSALEFGQLAPGAEEVARIKTGSSELWQTPLWLGAAGLLLSPSRGLLVYTPFLAAAFAGAVLAWRDEKYASLRFLTVAVPALWLPAFAWFDWWGGWTYGYRPIVDSVPLIAMLCVPAIDRIFSNPAWKAAFVAAVAWSAFVQVLGVLAYTPWQWNARALASGSVANVDFPRHRHRLWSMRDSQIAYLIGNFAAARAARKNAVARGN